MKEKLKMLSQVLSALTADKVNTKDKVKFRDTLIAASGDVDDAGNVKKYADYDESDREGIDEAVDALFGLGEIMQGVFDARAKLTFKFFKSLQNAGFDEKAALLIVAHQQNISMIENG